MKQPKPILIKYYNPRNRDEFFRGWYYSDAIKLDYIVLGIVALIISMVVISLWLNQY